VIDLEQAGVPRSVAMKLTGHKTETVYQRYAIVSDADLQAAAQRLSAAATERSGDRPGDHTALQAVRSMGTETGTTAGFGGGVAAAVAANSAS
jgi:hypothetical protein